MKSYSLHKGISWPAVLFGPAVFVVALGLLHPFFFLHKSRGGNRTKALANAKAIAGGLPAFKSEYRAYPCNPTCAILEEDPNDKNLERIQLTRVEPDVLPSGTSANAYLIQLIASDMIDTKKIFIAPDVPGTREGDGIMGSADKLLAPDENSFA